MTEIAVDPALITAFALALVRASAWLFITPPFNTTMLPIPVKVGVAAALALAVAPHIADPNLPLQAGPFVVSLVTQAAIGFAFGMLTLMLVQAVAAAGSFVDLFAGYSLATIYDPLSGANNAVFGRFYQLIAVTLLFTTNGHLILINGFFRSFQAVPLGGVPTGDVAALFVENLGQFLVAAIEIAGPVLACLFLTELTLGLLTRAAPNLNVFALAFPLRVIVALIVVAVALPLIAPALENLVSKAVAPFGG